MKNFGLIGASGYVAPRHLRAISDTGNRLVAAMDPFDCAGVLDSYFPSAAFFTEIERFDRHLAKRLKEGEGIEYLSICSPNYLHDAHARFGLRLHSNVICEKPLVLNPWNVEALSDIENEFKKKVFTILQLRLHPSVIELKKRFGGPLDKKIDIDLTYITSRGNWYYASWKGEQRKSGGIATNIGIHFFDMLSWIFGPVQENVVHISSHDRAAGFLELENARVRWFLSINADTLPSTATEQGKKTYRSLRGGGEEWEFSGGFEDLHTKSYEQILNGKGFGLEEAYSSIQIVHDIRYSNPVGLKGEYHPLAEKKLSNHPFD